MLDSGRAGVEREQVLPACDPRSSAIWGIPPALVGEATAELQCPNRRVGSTPAAGRCDDQSVDEAQRGTTTVDDESGAVSVLQAITRSTFGLLVGLGYLFVMSWLSEFNKRRRSLSVTEVVGGVSGTP
jgi:hypothetical protein